MISHVRGTVAAVGGTHVVIDVGGFGVRAECTPETAGSVRWGEDAELHTALVVREDSLTLYGFSDPDERDCFTLAMSASGVGPRIAQAMMAVLGAAGFCEAIAAGDDKRIAKTPGIGPKTAQKIILELRDKVHAPTATLSGPEPTPARPEAWREQVTQGLEGLGWSAKDAESACDQVAPLAETETNVAVLLRAALQTLAKK